MAPPDVEERRPVGRPSKALERTEQILAAVETCIVRHGIAGTTTARIAEIAGVQRSLIHHYVGTRDEMLRAAAERVVQNINELVATAVPDGDDPLAELSEALDMLFDASFQIPEIAYVIDELAVEGFRNPDVRAMLSEMYRGFVDAFDELLAAAAPEADRDERRTVAHCVIGLAESYARFADYGFDADNQRRMRTAAITLLDAIVELP